MNLREILGLAMILYFVVFSIADERRIRSLDDPDTEPVTRPPLPTSQTQKAESLARARIDQMRKRKLDHLLLNDYRFTSRISKKDMSDVQSICKKLNEMLQEMLVYLNLPPDYSVEVIPDEDMSIAPDRGAECDFSHRRIRIFLRCRYTPELLVSMLCHECAHYFCWHYSMYEYKHILLNEWYTDTVVCLMGFSKYILAPGCTQYLKTAQLEAVRWTLLQERKALAAGQQKQAS